MINENDLKVLGFTQFEHLRKQYRDGVLRMTWVGSIENYFVTVRVVFQEDIWKLELLEIDNDFQEYFMKKYFPENYTLDHILTFIRQSQE